MSTRNVAAVRTLFDSYREAWREHRMPVPPCGLLVWAEGAVAEVGGHVLPVEPHDVADAPFFLQIEADYYWSAIPDWRITEVDVAGEGDTVLSFAKFEGTGPDGAALDPIWMADRWHFNAQGQITRWQQITDLAAWGRWGALTGKNYQAHVGAAFAAAGQPPRFVP